MGAKNRSNTLPSIFSADLLKVFVNGGPQNFSLSHIHALKASFSPIIFFTRCSLRYALTNQKPDQSFVGPDLCLNDIWLQNFNEGKCQFTEILRCPEYVNLQRFYSEFLVPRVCQFTEILWCPEYVNLQRFCSDFMVPRVCQFTEILLRFYGAPNSISIYRLIFCLDFMVPRVCQFTEILWCPEYVNLQGFCLHFMVPRVCQFTEILQRFHGAPSMSIYRDFDEWYFNGLL